MSADKEDRDDLPSSIWPDWSGRARRRRGVDHPAFFRRARRRAETRRRANRDRYGVWAKLSARSAAIWLDTPKILDALAHGDGLRGQGWGAEHAVRDARQHIDAVSSHRYRSCRIPDTRVAMVHRIADP